MYRFSLWKDDSLEGEAEDPTESSQCLLEDGQDRIGIRRLREATTQ